MATTIALRSRSSGGGAKDALLAARTAELTAAKTGLIAKTPQADTR